ncbi:hypothetical protein HYX14_03860 [Candidatus Woesearchaeota archaeon]|nr:hypothetical protein [Candidatus Woesearchaeota archaeon]
MASFITIVLFFAYLLGLGFTATYWVRKPEHFLERLMVYAAIGLGVFPILSIILNFLHIPLDWKIFLLLSVAFPVYILIRKIQKREYHFSFRPVLRKSDLILIAALLIFAASLFMYVKGAFAYPYLEDEDPWGHAVGVKYVALEKNAYDPPTSQVGAVDTSLSYIDPYPPAYDVMMGISHQTSPEMQWTLKFFNALIISLGILFFFLFAKEFTQSSGKALLATFFLAAVPAYMSHFIWAHSLAIALLFPALYALWKIREEKNWMYIAAIMVASIWVSQNVEQPLKLTTMMLIFIIVAGITLRRSIKWELTAVGSGILLSMVWWGTMVQKYGLRNFVRYYTGDKVFSAGAEPAVSSVASSVSDAASSATSSGILQKLLSLWKSFTGAGGSASRAYSTNDFFIAKENNMINGPIGIGLVVSLLVLFGLIYVLWKYRSSIVEEKNSWLAVTLFWLIFTFWAVNGATFPVSVARGSFRSWMLLAIPVAILAAEATHVLMRIGKKFKVPAFIVLVLIVAGALFTSGIQKYKYNTTLWPTSGSFVQQAEPFEYGQWFATIPPNTPVFLYAPRDKLVIGYNAYTCVWCEDITAFRKTILEKDAKELHSFLASHQYEYLILNGAMDRKYFMGGFGENKTNELLPRRYEEIQKSGLFTPVYYKENLFLVLKVNY